MKRSETQDFGSVLLALGFVAGSVLAAWFVADRFDRCGYVVLGHFAMFVLGVSYADWLRKEPRT